MRIFVLAFSFGLGLGAAALQADPPCPDLVISEFMAKNVHGIKDSDGTPQDWIEIHNPCLPSVSLAGWYLTDDMTNLTKWQFPAVTLVRNDFIVVFASAKNRAVAGSELHTNFSLDAGGEYLALIRPDGTTIQQEFTPKFPDQFLDISYGSPQTVSQFLAADAPCTYHVPTAGDAALGETWTATSFDDTGWTTGQMGLGFLTTAASQFDVTYYKANINVNTTTNAETVISDPSKQTSVTTVQSPVINYLNTGSSAHFGVDAPFPSTTIGVNVEDFVVLATGSVVIPSAGPWTFGVNSDDGFSLELTNGTSNFTAAFPGTRAPGDTLGVFNVTQPGPYDVRLVFFERGGGAGLEFFAAQGSFSSFNSSAFRLVGDTANGGLSVVGFGGDVHTDVMPVMQNVNSSIWTRTAFNVADPLPFSSMTLKIRYEDGFVAYLNGTQIAGANSPAPTAWDSAATIDRPIGNAYVADLIDISSSTSLLQAGTNVLAIHGLNDAASNGDFLVLPSINAAAGQIDPSVRRFFTTPTPGNFNNAGYPAFAGSVQFSANSGLFSTNFSVSITTNSPTATIRYTTNGSAPTETSGTVYTAPININATTQLRARAFQAGLAPGPVLSRHFVKTDASISSFSSNLPVFVLENYGAGQAGADIYQTAYMGLFEPDPDGRTRLTSPPTIQTRGGIRIRGSSTESQPKHNYRMETWDEDGEDLDIVPLGMPAESDWILYAPYFYDRALIRNAFVYELSNQIGRYAVRTRLVEVYLNIDGGPLQASDNQGVYVFMENIKSGPDRVNITQLEPTDVAEPEVTGGWMLKIDRADPGEIGFSAAGQAIRYLEPDEEYVLDAQATWLTNYINSFGTALNGPNFANPALGYAQYIDTDAWIDHHILNVLTKNVDALRLSTYMFKDRLGKIEMGPVWDFDRSMDSYDSRDNSFDTWNGLPDATDFFGYTWWNRLFQDPNFMQAWIDRWSELRQDAITPSNMNAIIDEMGGQLQEASVRNFAKWPSVAPASGIYQTEIDNLKTWLTNRVGWIDSQFTQRPAFNHAPGQIAFGYNLELSAPAGTIYYTLDGSDPRLPGGAVSPTAIAYSAPIVINSAVQVRARALNGAAWSAPTNGQFVLEFAANPDIVINEIMYAPAGGLAREFIEFHNRSITEAIDMSGWTLSGLAATLAPGTILPPNAYAVVVEDIPAFQAAYGTSILVLGEYAGQADNSGETIILFDSSSIERGRITYDNVAPWPTIANTGGPSLELIDSSHDLDRVANWAASILSGGTPGAPNSRAAALPALPRVVINEVLPSNTLLNMDEHGDRNPWIEIYNPDVAAADLTGLYLTNNYATPLLWPIPAGITLCQGERLLVWADNEPFEGSLHANFTLAALTGQVGLCTAGGLIVDYANYANIPINTGYGRYPDGHSAVYPLSVPTPLAANAAGTSPMVLNEYNGVGPTRLLKDNASDTYWGRIVGNGGDWFELVVTQDHLDIRGWQLVLSDSTGLVGQSIETLTLTNHAIWSNLRRGTIITVSEDLGDNISYDPANGDWWINVRASTAGSGLYITPSNFPVSNDNWQITIKTAQGTTVFGPAGEGVQPVSGIGNDEICKLEDDPSAFVTARANYQDGSSSTFGSPNIYSSGTLVQNFGPARDVLEPCLASIDCDDGNPCTLDECAGNECIHSAISPCYELQLDSSDAVNGTILACANEQVAIAINAAGLPVAADSAHILISYDPGQLQFVALTPGDGGSSPWNSATLDALTVAGGEIDCTLSLPIGTTSDGTIATLQLAALPAAVGMSPSLVQFSAGCAPALNELTTESGIIRTAPANSLSVGVSACVVADVVIPGLTGSAAEGGAVATRDVEFALTACGGSPDVRIVPVTFHRNGGSGIATVELRNVNPLTTWLAVCEGHTLRRRVPIAINGGSAAPTVSLISGDLQTAATPQDNTVDILDFAILATRWNSVVADCAVGPPANCPLGADVSGDGTQNTADFSALQINFMQTGDAADNCPPPGGIGTPPIQLPALPEILTEMTPIKKSIEIDRLPAELRAIQSADLNFDGRIDSRDIRKFAADRGITLRSDFTQKLRAIESESVMPASHEKEQSPKRQKK